MRRIGLALTAVLAVIMLAPFFYMVSRVARPEDYAGALTAAPFARFWVNSVLFAGAAAAGQVLTSAAAAYAFARLRFPGRDRVFLVFLSVSLVPGIALLVPRFLL